MEGELENIRSSMTALEKKIDTLKSSHLEDIELLKSCFSEDSDGLK
jgi:hypothetical protein